MCLFLWCSWLSATWGAWWCHWHSRVWHSHFQPEIRSVCLCPPSPPLCSSTASAQPKGSLGSANWNRKPRSAFSKVLNKAGCSLIPKLYYHRHTVLDTYLLTACLSPLSCWNWNVSPMRTRIFCYWFLLYTAGENCACHIARCWYLWSIWWMKNNTWIQVELDKNLCDLIFFKDMFVLQDR